LTSTTSSKVQGFQCGGGAADIVILSWSLVIKRPCMEDEEFSLTSGQR